MKLNIPLLPQRGARACLPACVRMVLAFYGIQVSEEELSRLMGKTRAGTSVLNVELLENAELGVKVESGPFNADRLRQILDEGCPVIAAVRTASLPYWKPDRPHTVVMVGYDEDSVHLNDPKFPETSQTVSWRIFLEAWEELGRFGAIIRK